MKASGKQDDGYEIAKRKHVQKSSTSKLRKALHQNAEDEKRREALDAMFAVMHLILEAQQRAYAGESDLDKHVAVMRRLLRYVQCKKRKTTQKAEAVRRGQRRNIRA